MGGDFISELLTTYVMVFRKKLCGREDLFFGLHLNLEEKWSSADEKTFVFGLHLNFVEKLHERSQAVRGAIRCHIFQKGAIVQKKLKTSIF